MADERDSILPSDGVRVSPTAFPAGLLEWAGHRRGGVRRMFSPDESRPSGKLIKTPLVMRLRKWAVDVAAGREHVPRIVLLVGGPGNGKTEAVEDAIRELESSLAIDGAIREYLSPRFNPLDGSTVPRSVLVDIAALGSSRKLRLTLVQDASVGEPGGASAALCLLADLEEALAAGSGVLYLACVNRGILDDALIAAGSMKSAVHPLVTAVVGAVAARLGAPSCWPLGSHPDVAIWPMDVESLLLALDEEPGASASPGGQALSIALDAERWPPFGSCSAGEKCPFCLSRELLARHPHQESLLRILRGFELATGKRWSFRDLLSLLSYLLAGSPPDGDGGSVSPCEWAAHLAEVEGSASARTENRRLVAPFLLVAAQYQHALFGTWPRLGRSGLRRELRDLGLEDDPTLRGLSAFLAGVQSISVPRTIRTELTAIAQALDPANANPDLEVDVSAKSKVMLRDIDARFSHSVRDGVDLIRKYQFLSPNELDLLRRLSDADDRLGSPEVRNKKPTTAAALQVLVREFSCRLVRRTLGVRNAVVRDRETIEGFSRLLESDEQLVFDAAKQVEALMNENGRFTVTLNNTFGEPPPPETRRVVLETNKQKVRPAKPDTVGRPRSDLRFLTVGSKTATQAIPLTYELFRAVQELRGGMLAASLPRTVVAALDAARARLAGRVVRDEEALDGAEMRIGIRSERIGVEDGRFHVRTEAQP